MFSSISRFRQAIAHTHSLMPKVDRLKRRLAEVTTLHQQIQASSDDDEIQKLRKQMKVIHPIAVALKLGEAQRELRQAKVDEAQRLREAREEAITTITNAAGGPGGLHANPRARIALKTVSQAALAIYQAPEGERLEKSNAFIEELNEVEGELEKIRESAIRWKQNQRRVRPSPAKGTQTRSKLFP